MLVMEERGCLGDFNEILFNQENEGGKTRQQRCMDKFRGTWKITRRKTLIFTRIPSLGEIITIVWSVISGSTMQNSEWRMRFPLYRVINGDPKHPVIVDCGDVAPTRQKSEGQL